MPKGINNVCQRYNGSIIFKIKQTPGDIVVPRTSHGIYTRTIPEGYYMNRNVAKKTNPVINFFKRMYDEMKAIIAEMKTKSKTPFEPTDNIKGTTIEI